MADKFWITMSDDEREDYAYALLDEGVRAYYHDDSEWIDIQIRIQELGFDFMIPEVYKNMYSSG